MRTITSIEDTIGYQNEGEICVVCGKGLGPGEVLAKIHQGGSKLPICCPLCLEAYEKDPKPYLEKLAQRTLLKELRKLEDTPPAQGAVKEVNGATRASNLAPRSGQAEGAS